MEAIFSVKNKQGKKDESIKVHQSLIIGRSKSAKIVVSDRKISGEHCRITFKYDRLEILDLDSKNGTYLNGIRIEQSEIFMGDEIKIGDSVLILNETVMTPESIETLTFPGPFRERIDYELKADFTGARVQNQLYLKEHDGKVNPAFQEREINLRKKANSKIRLSKAEIKQQHRTLSLVSSLIDISLLLALVILPVFLLQTFSGMETVKLGGVELSRAEFQRHKLTMMVVCEIALVSLYMMFNMKMLKYSIGEKISGIEDLHGRQ